MQSKQVFMLGILVSLTCCYFKQVHAESSWQCVAQDSAKNTWYGNGEYQRQALNIAFESCKKQSKQPESCYTAKESCEMFMDGTLSSRPMWRCMALDFAGIPWHSNIYDQANDAVLAALAYCKAYSAVPRTCYIDPYICRDLNVQRF